MKYIFILIFIISFSSCNTGSYVFYDYKFSNIRANKERPKVYKSYPKSKMKKNIKNNNTYIRK